jgi:hypothetical protein
MLPTFPEQALLRVKFVPYADLKVGMIVGYKSPVGFHGHRLVERTARGNFIAKGDNEPEVDCYLVTPSNYQGVLVLFTTTEVKL